MLRALACCAFAAGLLRACSLGAFRSLRASPGSNAPRIPPGRVMLSMRCLPALESTGLGLLGWAGLGWAGCAGTYASPIEHANKREAGREARSTTREQRSTNPMLLACYFVKP